MIAVLAVPTSVLITILIFLSKNWVSERLRQSIGFEYARALEEFRAAIAKYESVQAAAISSLTTVHLAGHTRRLAAIETIWSETIRLRQRTPLYASRADILVAHEFESAFENDRAYAAAIQQVSRHDEVTDLLDDRADVEVARAFCGEYLFALFFAYRAFTARVAALLRDGFEKRRVRCWHDDPHLQHLVRTVPTADEVREIEALPVMRLRNTQAVIERKMVQHITDVLSGKAAADANLLEARNIVRAVDEMRAGA